MAETIASSREVGGFPDKCKPLDVFRATLAKRIEEHVRDHLNGYYRKPWGGRFGYSPRLGWAVRTMHEERTDGVFVRVEKLKDGQAVGFDGVIHRADLTRDTLAKQIKYARRMIRNHGSGPQQ